MAKFKYPKIYDFPPFFTRQPNLNVWNSQLNNWIRLILLYSEHHRYFIMSYNGVFMNNTLSSTTGERGDADTDADDDDNLEEDYEVDGGNNTVDANANANDREISDMAVEAQSIFHNTSIQRSVKSSMIRDIMDEMIKEGKLENIDAKNPKAGYFVLWKSYDEWGDLILDWIDNLGTQKGTILTIYEISNGDLSFNQVFYRINKQFLINVLSRLSKRGRCVMISEDNGDIMGVKFI